MAIESKKIILHKPQGVPSKKAFLVAIPMDMYRIKTQDFVGGLDFFQHTVLRFKARPDITDKEIAECTGFDENLIALVKESMIPEQLSDSGVITEEGNAVLKDPHRLLAKPSSRTGRLGYVFKLPSDNAILNNYVEEIDPVDNKGEKDGILQVVEPNAQGNNKSLSALCIIPTKKSTTPPSEIEILRTIDNTYCKEHGGEEDDRIDYRNQELAIQFVPNVSPTKVIVCTYVYLPEINDSTFASDWEVMDPFNSDTSSPQLKFYLESLNDKAFVAALSEHFSEAPTVEKLSFGELRRQLEEQVQIDIDALWGSAFERLDKNLQFYIKVVMQKKREMGYCHYNSREHSQSFIANIQTALECILKAERSVHKDIYLNNRDLFEDVLTRYKLRETLKDIKVVNKSILNKLFNQLSKLVQNSKDPVSLYQYLPEFVLSYQNDKTNPLFVAIGSNLEMIIEIANIRNEHDHGQTYDEGALKALSQEDSDKYYQLLTDIITSYIH